MNGKFAMIIQNERKKTIISILTMLCFVFLTVFSFSAANIQSDNAESQQDTSFSSLGRGYYICLPSQDFAVVNNAKSFINSLPTSDNNRTDASQSDMYYKGYENLNIANIYDSREIVSCVYKKDGKK